MPRYLNILLFLSFFMTSVFLSTTSDAFVDPVPVQEAQARFGQLRAVFSPGEGRSPHTVSPLPGEKAARTGKGQARSYAYLSRDRAGSPIPMRHLRKTAPRYHGAILEASDIYRVDPALIKAVIMVESAYDPRAVSRSGAKGLMQLMPATAKNLGVGDIFDPAQNIRAGVQHLRELLDRLDGDMVLALAAYNAGMSRIRAYGGVPPFKSTRFYLKKVFEYYTLYKQLMAENPAVRRP
jgi:soluble lytic murein transglycosylase-like protein